MTEQQQQASAWFYDLRQRIIKALEALEAENSGDTKFDIKPWQRESQPGGGEMGLLQNGKVFEKAGVNVSTVWGEFSEEFRDKIPGAVENGGKFWACGLSVVVHPRNPFVPPVHMNTRHIVTSKSWFGGGVDLNPIYPQEDDTKAFHTTLAVCCGRHDPSYYKEYKEWADKYFWNAHRREPRGVGGIFYDYLDKDWNKDFAFTRDVGETFLDIYPQLVRKNVSKDYGEKERAHQLFRRGRYAEFNLLYDRGTNFGLKTGGNPDAILMSLPPLAAWP